MIITCPACEAQYILPDDAIGESGRRVKCTTCAYTWLQPQPGHEDDIVEAQEFVYDAEKFSEKRHVVDTRVHTPVVSNGTGRAIGTGIGLGLLFFVITIGFLAVIRVSVTAGWPPLALLFDTLHLSVAPPGEGLAIEDLTASVDQTEKALRISGKLANKTEKMLSLPSLLVRISGETGWLKDWPIDLNGKLIEPGQTVGFQYTLPDAPAQGGDITVRFSE